MSHNFNIKGASLTEDCHTHGVSRSDLGYTSWWPCLCPIRCVLVDVSVCSCLCSVLVFVNVTETQPTRDSQRKRRSLLGRAVYLFCKSTQYRLSIGNSWSNIQKLLFLLLFLFFLPLPQLHFFCLSQNRNIHVIYTQKRVLPNC